MAEKFDIYKCEICGNVVEVLINGAGNLVCCGEDMKLQIANTGEEIKGEYHIPVAKETDNGKIEIQVGEKPHPMTEAHQIQFIEVISDDKKTLVHKFLDFTDEPKVEIEKFSDKYTIRENCNLHNLWQSEK